MIEIKINVFECLGSDSACSSEDGELLFKAINKGLNSLGGTNDILVLDWANISLITPIFLNTAIG